MLQTAHSECWHPWFESIQLVAASGCYLPSFFFLAVSFFQQGPVVSWPLPAFQGSDQEAFSCCLRKRKALEYSLAGIQIIRDWPKCELKPRHSLRSMVKTCYFGRRMNARGYWLSVSAGEPVNER